MSITQSSSSEPSSAALNAPAVQSTIVDAGSANPGSELPDLQHPSASDPADPPADPPAAHGFTFTHPSPAEVVQPTPVSCTYGPFRVWRKLGQGGFAVAMGAQDVTSNRLLCLKVFSKDRFEHKYAKEAILDELEAYKRISCALPCPAARFLMGLEMSFQTNDKICFAMDLMASDLWVAQMTLGINALHEIGIIHRDIKAANILIDVRENVRITDFGLSYVDKDEGPLDRQRNYSADAMGTTHTMAPEVLRNRSDPRPWEYGAPADWWSLGCVIYQLVSKKHKSLFVTGDDIFSYVSWCSSRDEPSKQFPALEDLGKNNIANLISGLLQPDPSSRFGFAEVVNHRSFLSKAGTSEFTNAYSRALGRQEVPSSLPDLQRGQDTSTAEIWFPQPSWEESHVPDVDWVKPTLFSSL